MRTRVDRSTDISRSIRSLLSSAPAWRSLHDLNNALGRIASSENVDSLREEGLAIILEEAAFEAADLGAARPADVDPRTGKLLGKRLALLMRSDVWALSMQAAWAANGITQGALGKGMTEILIADMERGHWIDTSSGGFSSPASARVLLDAAEREELPRERLEMILASLANPSKGDEWKIAILAQSRQPLDGLVGRFKELLPQYTRNLRPDLAGVLMAISLLRWGFPDSHTLTFLTEVLHRFRPDERVIRAFASGFAKSAVPAEYTQRVVEGLVRIQMPWRDRQDVLQALSAAIGAEQTDSQVVSAAVLTLVGVPATQGVIDYASAAVMLAKILASGAVSPLAMELLAKHAEDEDPNVRARIFGVVREASEQRHVRGQVVRVLLQLLSSKQMQARNFAAETLCECVDGERLSLDQVGDFGPLWAAAREDIDTGRGSSSEQYHRPFFWRPVSQSAAHLHVALIDRGLLPLASLPPSGFVDASEQSKTAYQALFLECFRGIIIGGTSRRLQDQMAAAAVSLPSSVARANAATNLRLAVQAGKLTETTTRCLIELANDESSDVRTAAMEGLGHCIAGRAGDISEERILIKGLSDRDGWVRRAAAEGLSRAAQAGISSRDVADALHQALLASDDDSRWSVLKALSSVLKLGFGSEAMLVTIVASYKEAANRASLVEAELSRHREERHARSDRVQVAEWADGVAQELERAQALAENDMRASLETMGNAAAAGLCNDDVVSLLLEAYSDTKIEPAAAVRALGYAAGAVSSPIDAAKLLTGAYAQSETGLRSGREQIVMALSHAYRNPSLRPQIEPLLFEAILSGFWRQLDAASEVIQEGVELPEGLLDALMRALKQDPEMQSAAVAVGRWGKYHPLSLGHVNEMTGLMSSLALMKWDGYLEAMGMIVSNPDCQPDVLEVCCAYLFWGVYRGVGEFHGLLKKALTAGGLLPSEEVYAQVTAVLNPNQDCKTDEWKSAASALAGAFDGPAGRKFTRGLVFALRNEREPFLPDYCYLAARLLGHFDSDDAVTALMEVFQNSHLDGFCRSQEGAAFALVEVGQRHPEIWDVILRVLASAFGDETESPSAEDREHETVSGQDATRHNIKCAVIEALRQSVAPAEGRQDILLRALRGLASQDSTEYRKPVAAYAADALGQVGRATDNLRMELIKAFLVDDPRIRDAAWSALRNVTNRED